MTDSSHRIGKVPRTEHDESFILYWLIVGLSLQIMLMAVAFCLKADVIWRALVNGDLILFVAAVAIGIASSTSTPKQDPHLDQPRRLAEF